tara:strand:+ start:1033 stop:1443 length:411 start_codon:yes stop_codon:yes gene_type:complete
LNKPNSNVYLQVVLKNGSLAPITENVAQLVNDYKEGQLFEIKAVANRSNPHHALYWVTLADVVKATGKWPTKDHLHNDLKMLCGYYRSVINGVTGQIYYIPDSIAFESMDQKEFMTFFENAMQKLSEAIGYDPLTR